MHDDEESGVTDAWTAVRPDGDRETAQLIPATPIRRRTYYAARSVGAVLPEPPDVLAHFAKLEAQLRKTSPELFDGSFGPGTK